jgi:medium-chain acyl-[acyl-carrier-protein] hydrolase
MLRAVAELGGTPAAVLENRELMELALPVLRADFRLHERYWSDAVLRVPITAFVGLRDVEVPPDIVQDWRACTQAGFTLHRIVGDHFFVRTHKSELAALISSALRP